jgi:hypothetical protein
MNHLEVSVTFAPEIADLSLQGEAEGSEIRRIPPPASTAESGGKDQVLLGELGGLLEAF